MERKGNEWTDQVKSLSDALTHQILEDIQEGVTSMTDHHVVTKKIQHFKSEKKSILDVILRFLILVVGYVVGKRVYMYIHTYLKTTQKGKSSKSIDVLTGSCSSSLISVTKD